MLALLVSICVAAAGQYPKAKGRCDTTHPGTKGQSRQPFVTGWVPTTERIVSEGS